MKKTRSIRERRKASDHFTKSSNIFAFFYLYEETEKCGICAQKGYGFTKNGIESWFLFPEGFVPIFDRQCQGKEADSSPEIPT
jgi:hypothetical protein